MRYLKKGFKVFLWIIASIFFLILLVVILIQLPAVQNFAKNKLVAYVQRKIKTPFRISKLYITFPKRIVLTGVYAEDQHRDSLLVADTIRVDIALFKLLSKEIRVSDIELAGITTHINRVLPDTSFNFDYIVKAFSGPDTAKVPQKPDTSAGYRFTLGDIHLRRINLRYHDDGTGNDESLYLGRLDTRVKRFDPNASVYEIPGIDIADVRTYVRMYKPKFLPTASPPDTTPSKPVSLKVNHLGLQSIGFKYDNELSHSHMLLDVGQGAVDPEKLDLGRMEFLVDKVVLAHTSFSMVTDKIPPVPKPKGTPPSKGIPPSKDTSANSVHFAIGLKGLDVNDLNFRMDDYNQRPVKSGIDYAHLNASGINADIRDVIVRPDEYKGDIRNLSLKEKSGLDLRQLSAAFLYGKYSTQLKGLVIKTPYTNFHNETTLEYPSLDALTKDLGSVSIHATVDTSFVGLHDVFIFAPQLRSQFNYYANSRISLRADISGRMKDLLIRRLRVSGIGNTTADVSGTIRGLPDASRAYYDMKILAFSTVKGDVNRLAPNAVPKDVRIPDRLSLTGFFRGTTDRFSTHLNAKTSSGNADITGTMAVKAEQYDVRAILQNLDVGYLAKQEKTVGRLTLTANAKGQGFDYHKMTTAAKVRLSQGDIMGYTYHDINLDADILQGVGKLNAVANDPNLALTLNANADLRLQYPSAKLLLHADTINLTALNFVKDSLPMTIHGVVDADFVSTDPASLQGRLAMYNIVLVKDSMRYATDTITLAADHAGNQENIRLHAEMADIDLRGRYNLVEIAPSVEQAISRYYRIPGVKDTVLAAEDWTMAMKLRPSPIVLQLLPDLRGTDSINANMAFRSADHYINLKVDAPKIVYGKNIVSRLSVNAETDPQRLNYVIDAGSVATPSTPLYHTNVRGALANNEADAYVRMDDENNRLRYGVGLHAAQIPNGVRASLRNDSLVLNYQPWNTDNNNFIQYDSIAGVLANNFGIYKDTQSLIINSIPQTPGAPLEVAFNKFRINTVTSMLNEDSLAVEGVINGKAIATNVLKDPRFTSDLTISNVIYQHDTVGNIVVRADNMSPDAINADIRVLGHGNNAQFTGKYFTADGRLDMKMAMHDFNLSSLRGFLGNQVQEFKGSLEGNVNITGKVSQPVLDGRLTFKDALIIPTVTGAPLKFGKETLYLSKEGIGFDNFTLADSAGNKLVVNGGILTRDFKNYAFKVDVDADHFEAISTIPAPNRLFYGRMNFSTNLNLRGTLEAPNVEGDFRVNGGTDFTFVLPDNDPDIVKTDGVVRFIDKNHPDTLINNKRALDSMIARAQITGVEAALSIEVDSSAALTLDIDQSNGDKLTMRGRADLVGGMDRSGKTTLTGSYALSQGAYQLNISVLKRRFDIQPGSTILWTGDPTTAQINITADYMANTPAIDLVQAEVAGRPQVEQNRFKERLPFQVVLNMTGELLQPVITFDITLPDEQLAQYPEVDQKLQQVRSDPSQLDKQVFAVLLLNRFVQENPLVSSADGTNLTVIAKQSVGKIAADQLNQLGNSLVKGVNFNFDINTQTDYTTGTADEYTDLTVAASKRFFKDRMNLLVGSDFLVEKPANTARDATNVAGNIAVDYNLTRDGRYRVRGYRQNKFLAVLEGQIIETGVTFTVTVDYNKFREIFHAQHDQPGAKSLLNPSQATGAQGPGTNQGSNPAKDNSATKPPAPAPKDNRQPEKRASSNPASGAPPTPVKQ